MDASSIGGRVRRGLIAGAAAVGASVLALCVPVMVFAVAAAVRERGAPDQAAINAFAASVSPALMPWLVRVATLIAAALMVRRTASARAVDGLVVGVTAGVLNLAVTLAFGGALNARTAVSFLVVAALGWAGGTVGRAWGGRSVDRS